MASVAELKKSFFTEIDKVENREDFEKLRVKYLGREKRILAVKLLGNYESANFPLRVRGKRFEAG